ncbi:sigma-70 RNA polymerase sigma factor region 4 domain-containing protein [Paenibacillus chitinolyticus]|uniref:sigma-70 family RNA polymerase sigma factor n=1 Tax=Paenibacillus chitinolyticus TaxID=79263 RepID=UPI003641143F
MSRQSTLVEKYRKEVYRIGWRIQYKARVISNREYVVSDNAYSFTAGSFTESSDSRLDMLALIQSLPSRTGRIVLHELFIQDKTEAQVAKDLNMTQQAVNKWKRKMLRFLSQTKNSSISSS